MDTIQIDIKQKAIELIGDYMGERTAHLYKEFYKDRDDDTVLNSAQELLREYLGDAPSQEVFKQRDFLAHHMKHAGFIPVLTMFFLGLATIFFLNWETGNVVLQKIVYLIGPAVAIIAGFMTLRTMGQSGKRALVIKYVIAAIASWFTAECIILYMVWIGVSPYPSLADAFFLAGYAFFSKAMLLEAKLFDLKLEKLNKKILLTLEAVFALIVGLVIILAVKGYRPGDTLLANLTTISWSIGDLVIGSLSILLLAMAWKYRDGTIKKAWLWFAAAAMINLITDSIYDLNPSAIAEGSLWTVILDLMWESGYLCMAAYFLEMRTQLMKVQGKMGGKK